MPINNFGIEFSSEIIANIGSINFVVFFEMLVLGFAQLTDVLAAEFADGIDIDAARHLFYTTANQIVTPHVAIGFATTFEVALFLYCQAPSTSEIVAPSKNKYRLRHISTARAKAAEPVQAIAQASMLLHFLGWQ